MLFLNIFPWSKTNVFICVHHMNFAAILISFLSSADSRRIWQGAVLGSPYSPFGSFFFSVVEKEIGKYVHRSKKIKINSECHQLDKGKNREIRWPVAVKCHEIHQSVAQKNGEGFQSECKNKIAIFGNMSQKEISKFSNRWRKTS